MVNTQKGNDQLPIAEKNEIFWHISFFGDCILEKENTHIPWQLLIFTSFYWDYIPE